MKKGDRIYRELEANGTPALSFRTDDFILKITVPKIAEKMSVNVNVNAIQTSLKTPLKIIELVRVKPYISTSEMADIIRYRPENYC